MLERLLPKQSQLLLQLLQLPLRSRDLSLSLRDGGAQLIETLRGCTAVCWLLSRRCLPGKQAEERDDAQNRPQQGARWLPER